MKRRVYQNCRKSAMLYGSEIWCLRRTESAMCGVKLLQKRKAKDLMGVLM